ncbi:hypothetical protein CDAR_89081 [Caerostris darwini]|uniref:Uncharacterized protein n=1 Tax=Caerostris darwini TaxID=1538125 RepID=A0AAV4WEW3_9ARAC|nr:hypothetical protein CDAR_89081 [Caerostris darwini]
MFALDVLFPFSGTCILFLEVFVEQMASNKKNAAAGLQAEILGRSPLVENSRTCQLRARNSLVPRPKGVVKLGKVPSLGYWLGML